MHLKSTPSSGIEHTWKLRACFVGQMHPATDWKVGGPVVVVVVVESRRF